MANDTFVRARRDHSRENAEDYVELIDDLIRHQGEARLVTLAEKLGLSHVTVSRTLQRLKREGLVRTEPYRSIHLTDQGKAMADASRERHELVRSFLLSLGISPEVAEIDAEGIEHHVSAETLTAMQRVLKRR